MIARRENLAVVCAALTAICVVPYLRDIRRGTTRPQRVSWLVFATLSIVAAVSQIAAGGGPGVWLAGGSAFGFTLVFVASIRHGEGGFAASDRVAPCRLAAAADCENVLWSGTDAPLWPASTATSGDPGAARVVTGGHPGSSEILLIRQSHTNAGATHRRGL